MYIYTKYVRVCLYTVCDDMAWSHGKVRKQKGCRIAYTVLPFTYQKSIYEYLFMCPSTITGKIHKNLVIAVVI